MSKHRLWFLAVVAFACCAIVATAANAEPDVAAEGTAQGGTAVPELTRSLVGIDVEAGAGPVVVLETDGWVEYETLVLENPDRLVLDLHGVVSRLDEHSFSVATEGVVRVRAGQYRTEPQPVSRIVFDLERAVPFEIEQGAGTVLVRFGSDAPVSGVAVAEAVPEVIEVEQAEWPAEADDRAMTDAIAAALGADVTREADPVEQPEADPVAGVPIEEPVEVVTVAKVETPAPEVDEPVTGRAVEAATIDELLDSTPRFATPAKAAPAQSEDVAMPQFQTKTIVTDATVYTGKRISLNLVDADIKQLFRLFHDVSGLNFVLDPSVDGRVTVVLDHVPWDQALDLVLQNNGLDKVVENNVIRIAPTSKLAAEAAQRKQLKEAKELEVEPITITRTLSYAKADAVQSVIREGGVLSPRGKVIVDERTNTLIVSDIPKKVQPLDELISTLDTETPQVMIEARIVETSRQFTQDLGIVWGFTAVADASRGTQTGLSFPYNAGVKYGLNLPGKGEASSLAFKFGNILDSFTLDLALNTLESEGRGRVLSAPKISAQNNERAEIEQGVRIPVVNTTATEINVEFVSASLRLEVTPQITAEGTIILDVTVENNSPDFQNTVGDVPPINTQRAQTKVMIADGGTTVIGGIFQVTEGKSEVGVPWFRKIPGLGWLFKTTSVTQQNRELLIFITPRIMKIG